MIGSANPVAGIKVLHKALNVLETIRGSAAGLGLADVSRRIGLPKPTVYRILSTLEARGYLDRREDGRYRLARRLTQEPDQASVEEVLRCVARPVMQALADSCKETVNLGVLDGSEVTVIETIESPHAVRMSSKVGNRRYLHSTALGKVILADLDESEVLRFVRRKSLPRLTPKTIADVDQLLEELRKVRQQGHAMDNQEHEPDGRCLGAGIRGVGGRVVGALSISGPAHRMTRPYVRSLLPHLLEACEAISAELRRRW
ncbi:MAG: helix-turn-helix domain-containing protein [Luteitalea sp.]|nr:helix-turn-helix domain-containing protein [Luteitalea sp.]